MCSSDSDFETNSLLKKKSRKVNITKNNHAPALYENNSIMDRSVDKPDPKCLEEVDSENKRVEWDNLDASLKALLPSEKGLTYVITELNQLPADDFPGAPEHSYEATVQINLTEKEAA